MAECPGTPSDSSEEYYSLSSEEEGGGEGFRSDCEGMNGLAPVCWPALIPVCLLGLQEKVDLLWMLWWRWCTGRVRVSSA